MSKMKKKSNQNKFMKIIKMPFRALAKARDFYVRTMNNIADSGNYDGLGWGGPVYVEPMSRSLSATTMRKTETDRDLTELVRAASTSALGNRILMTSLLTNSASTNSKGDASPLREPHKVGTKGVPRCGSVVMAKIEEDEPSNDGVENGVKMTKSRVGVLPRSGSKVVGETRKISFVL